MTSQLLEENQISLSQHAVVQYTENEEQKQVEIADGSFNPFTGPITKADDSEGVAAGVSLADADIIAMDWHVKGVATPLPQ